MLGRSARQAVLEPAYMTVTFADIEAAQGRIAGQVDRTPARYSRKLSQLTGAEVWVKFDNLHFTGSFKERGALNRLLMLTPEERKRGVVAASAGNHAQALAYHGGRLGVPVTIVMPEGTPFAKINGTRSHGATVVIEGLDFTGSTEAAKRLEAEKGYVFVSAFDDEGIVAGQGVCAIEFLEDAPDLEALVIPIGGGGLIAGCAIAAKGMPWPPSWWRLRWQNQGDEVEAEAVGLDLVGADQRVHHRGQRHHRDRGERQEQRRRCRVGDVANAPARMTRDQPGHDAAGEEEQRQHDRPQHDQAAGDVAQHVMPNLVPHHRHDLVRAGAVEEVVVEGDAFSEFSKGDDVAYRARRDRSSTIPAATAPRPAAMAFEVSSRETLAPRSPAVAAVTVRLALVPARRSATARHPSSCSPVRSCRSPCT